MLQSGFALEDELALFWHGYFATQASQIGASRIRGRLAWQQVQLFYRYGCTSFRDLLHSMVRNAALLRFLDNQTSTAASPNENFSRELLELFSLGEGHYSEQDVLAATRAFTGWRSDDAGNFTFASEHHDSGQKRFLGVAGNHNGDDIVELILKQPRCADYVAESLWMHFVSDELDSKVTSDWGRRLFESDYALPSILGPMRELIEERRREGLQRIKSPAELVIGTWAQFQLPSLDLSVLYRAMVDMGFKLYEPPDVSGWRGHSAWIDSSTLLARQKFVRYVIEAIQEIDRLRKGEKLSFGIDVADYTDGFSAALEALSNELSDWSTSLVVPKSLQKELSAIDSEELRLIATYLHSPEYQLI